MKYLSIFSLLFLIGCNDYANYGYQRIGGSDDLKEVSLPSGTRCVVYNGIQKGGISCNWEKTK